MRLAALSSHIFDSWGRNRWSRRVIIAAIIVVLLLVAARVAAPVLVRNAINARLDRIPGYRAHVTDVDLQLWRGAYRIQQLKLERRVEDALEPFVGAEEIDFSLAWRELLRGRVLSEIHAHGVTLTYVPTPDDGTAAPVGEPRWQEVINDLFPIEITHFSVERGSIRFSDPFADPVIDISLEGLSLQATGLRNRARPDEELPALITVHGTTIGGGLVSLHAAADPLAPRPRFELQLTVEEVHLPALNDYLLAHANVDVSEGTFTMFTEVSARDGSFEGYVKPFFDDVSFKDLPGQEKPLVGKLWQAMVSALVAVLKNKPRDQLATRMPFSGEFGDAEVGAWATIGNLLRHGFIEALTQRLEGFARTPFSDDDARGFDRDDSETRAN